MNRRQVLTLLGAVIFGPMAGCDAGDEGGDDVPAESPTASPTPTESTPNQQAIERYQSGVETLVAIKGTLDEWAENSVNNLERVKALQDRVATAREDVDAAEEHAGPDGELAAQIEQTKFAADFQELSLAFYEGGLQLIKLQNEANRLGDNELHQRAADTFADARQLTEDLQRVVDDMETVLDELDTDTLDEPSLAYTGDPFDYLDGDDRRLIDGLASYLKGREHIHLAFVQLETGQQYLDADEATQSREAWETGRSHVEAAISTFNTAIDNSYTPEDTRDMSFAFLGIANGLLDAFDKLVAGAKEAEVGNDEDAERLILEGYQILEETFKE